MEKECNILFLEDAMYLNGLLCATCGFLYLLHIDFNKMLCYTDNYQACGYN